MRDRRSVPQDQTIRELLSQLPDTPCRSSEFLEKNKWHMVEMGPMNAFDYEVFWGCMRIYEAKGTDYFPGYALLRTGAYGSFSEGISSWFEDDSFQSQRPADDVFREVVALLRFFCIDSYDGIPFSEFEEREREASRLYQAASAAEQSRRQERARATVEKRIENYFNFGDFSESRFRELSQKALSWQEKSLSINEALLLAQTAPHQTYIVLFQRDGAVCYIGKTEQPLAYIGARYKSFQADAAYFDAVEEAYADDLVISMKVFYDVELDKICPSLGNRKYATLKQAIFAYKRAEGIPRKTVLSAIKREKLRLVDLGNEQLLLDKLELHRALYPAEKT